MSLAAEASPVAGMTVWARRAARAAVAAATLVLGPLVGPARPVAAESGPEAFAHIYKVATHPRCVNCHGMVVPVLDATGKVVGKDSVPLVGDDMQPHPMSITLRHNPGAAGKALGIDCGTCHGDRNLTDPRTPPGASNTTMPHLRWQMPRDDAMRILPIRSAAGLSEEAKQVKLCKGWQHALEEMKGKNPDFKGHIAGDPLIEWAFRPAMETGISTEAPARQAAPGDHRRLQEAVGNWITWMESGGSCEALARPATPAAKPR